MSGETAVPTVTLTIDGREVTVRKGTNILEAARQLGIQIAYFCYHPGLSAPAVCRQCLVEVAGVPKPVPSCYTPAAEGMEVSTTSPKALAARRQMLEFTLVNHPIDCPICDKAGECILQKLYFDHDAGHARIHDPKVHKDKRVDAGPHIVLDQERCILCTRCIRVCDEIARAPQLTMAARGDQQVLTTAPGRALDNPYSLNTVDVCPVGALTAKDFRFVMRVWELMMTPSICTGCATGCNVEVHHRGSQIFRLVPRHNPAVNRYWMCDEGRFTYREVAAERLAVPLVDGAPARWDAALAAATTRLQTVLDQLTDSRAAMGVVIAATVGNEDAFVMAELARGFLGLPNAYVTGKPPAPQRQDDLLRSADVNPNFRGVQTIVSHEFGCPPADLAALEADLAAARLRGLLVLGADVPLSEAGRAHAAALEALVVITPHERGLARQAHVALPAATWAEAHATMTNRDGLVQRLRAAFPPPGAARPGWEVGLELGRSLGAPPGYPHARAVFDAMVASVPQFHGAEWGKEVPLVQLRFAGMRG